MMARTLRDELDKGRVGARLAMIRRISGVTQEEFASAAGITRTAYNQYETGAKLPSVDAAARLCETYDLTLDYIFLNDLSGLRQRTIEAIRAINRANDPNID